LRRGRCSRFRRLGGEYVCGSGEDGWLLLLLFSGSFGTTAASPDGAGSEKIGLLFLLLGLVLFYADTFLIGVFVIDVFGAIPEAIAVVFVYCPAAVLVFVIVVRPLTAREPSDLVGIIVIGKTQWFT